jgi:hypothetical protein
MSNLVPAAYHVTDSRKIHQKLNSTLLSCLSQDVCSSRNNSPLQFQAVIMSGGYYYYYYYYYRLNSVSVLRSRGKD